MREVGHPQGRVRAAERRVDLLNREVVISGWVVVAGVVAVGFGLGGFHFEISPADFLGLGTLLILGGGGLFWSMAPGRNGPPRGRRLSASACPNRGCPRQPHVTWARAAFLV